MKKTITLILALSTTLILVACGHTDNSTTKATSSSMHESSKTISKAPASSSSAASSSTTSSSKKATSKSQSSAIASSATGKNGSGSMQNKRTYQVPTKDKQNKNYKADGNLNKKGEFSVDQAGTVNTLYALKKLKTTLKNGPLAYRLVDAQIIQNNPKTKQAITMANSALNTTDIKGKYYTLMLHYDITNHSANRLGTDGVSTFTTNTGYGVNGASGLDNDAQLGTKGLPANKKTRSFAVFLLPEKTAKNLKTFRLEFSGAYTADGDMVSDSSNFMNVNFK
ncbi:hypothetical protein EQG49_02635 [Periweissella cryptocerci]|uniref:DUF4352 domain-containing protein n=1 Tax=Periweissella cryptocerci TaxID=2506420 RepID=A0A4P6YRZ4_9LACO|nr:hypothetical protein [Periweissella cryptocerci]QBO35439.1 hypothetical protein EQG49_02635 [Periweissella cryptocerci]